MSDNGNSVPISVMPGKNGGVLRRGNPGNSGRPRKEARDMLLREFLEQVPQLKKKIGKKGKITRKEFAELCAKYGLGTTNTETNSEGDDAPGRLTPDERRALLLRELSAS